MKLIVNIPAFNEEEKVGKTIQRIKRSFNSDFYVNGFGKVISSKLIQVVDDGSEDRTAEVAREAGADLIVSYKPNRRLAYSFKMASENALENGADLMVNIDADGQFDPEDIPKLLKPILKREKDMAIANRFGGKEAENIPWVKSFLNQVATKTIGFFLNYKIGDLTCGFRAHNKETLLRLNLTNIHFTYTQETIIDAIGKNLKLVWIPVHVTYFPERKSKIVKSIWNFVNNSSKIILKAVRDVRPLKFFGLPAIFFLIIALGGFIFFFYHYFQEFKITPYINYIAFSSVSLLLGIQLLIFSFIADMVKASRQLTEELMYQQRKERYSKNNFPNQ